MRNKTRFYLILIFFLMIVYLILTILTTYRVVTDKNPRLQEKIADRDYSYLYSFYIQGKPSVNFHPYLGDEKTPIVLIAVLDMNSEESRYFITNIFPNIRSEFIDTGIMKFYSKNYLLYNDIENEDNRYIYAKTLECINFLNNKRYYDIYFSLLNSTKIDNINLITQRYDIGQNSFIDCMKNKEFDNILSEAIESENYGDGIGQRFYIGIEGDNMDIIRGVASLNSFRRIIRSYQLMIGK